MNLLNKLSNFLFGKPPDIFDSKGKVLHHLPKEAWMAWEQRYHDEEHNWHHHKGFVNQVDQNMSEGHMKL